ncbi:22009_t:CDS:2 [Gigaspora rosea]|nr:22009_t:CDS:2 [Gigaspora rosea]
MPQLSFKPVFLFVGLGRRFTTQGNQMQFKPDGVSLVTPNMDGIDLTKDENTGLGIEVHEAPTISANPYWDLIDIE